MSNNVKGNRGLNFSGSFDIKTIIDNQQKVIKGFAEMKKAVETSGGNSSSANSNQTFNTKPLTEYQAGLLRIKQEALQFAKAKAEQTKADRDASLATQAALKEESRLKREQIANEKALKVEQSKRKPTQISNSQAEIDAYKKAQQGSMLYTAAINAEVVARAKLNATAANSAVANGTLNTGIGQYTQATTQQTQATNQNVLSKRQLAQMLAEEKLRQADATRELKNNAREMLNAKGSLEQRRAALIRLNTVYDRLSKTERESASGNRLANVIRGVTEQVKQLEAVTGRAQRNVGNYPNAFSKIGADAAKVTETVKGSGGVFSQIFSSIGNGALSVLAPLAAVGTAWSAVQKIFSHNVQISDIFADVRRTAKLSVEEIDNLADTLKGLGSRTSLEALLDIGTIGGRLGVRKNELPDFIKQVDELAVILKKELPGGAEAVAESLGRIVTIYKVTQAEGVSLGTALSKVGSNLLELAHAGPVTVKYLQDFTLGVAGTAASAKLSIPVISAYGAVLGESGQIASSAALSVTRLVTGLTTKTGKYAAIAQLADSTLTVEKFTRIVNTDTQAALNLFFKGLKAGNPVATEFAARLGSVGITTGKVTNAVKILAENQDKLLNRIASGSVAFEEGISVAHNFEIANDTLGASVDKLGNSIVNLTTNPNSNMYTFFKGVIDGSTKAVSALDILLSTVKGLTTDPVKFIGDSAAKSRAQSILKINEEAKKIAEASYRNKDTDPDGQRLDILKEEVKIRNEINTQYLKAKIAYENTPRSDRSLADTKAFQDVETRLQKQIALVRELNKIRNRGKVEVIGTGELVDTEADVRTTDKIKEEIKALQLANKKLGIETKEFKANTKEIVRLREELRLALGGKEKATPGISSELSKLESQRKLQAQIDALTKKGVDRQLSADDREVESVKDKYKKLTEDAIAYNKTQQKLDEERVKKGGKALGLRVNTSGLNAAENKELNALYYKAQVKSNLESLDKQKQDYIDYENFRLAFGQKIADAKYAGEVKSGLTYLQKLEQERGELLKTDPTQMNGTQKEYLAGLDTRINAEVEAEKQKYTKLLIDLQSYNSKVVALEDKYTRDKQAIADKADENGPAKTMGMYQVLAETYAADTDNLKASITEKAEAYRHLTEQVASYTKDQLRAQIEALEFGLKNITGLAPNIRERLARELSEVKIRLSLNGDEKAFINDLKKKQAEIKYVLENGIPVQVDGVTTRVKLTNEQYLEQIRLLGLITGEIKLTGKELKAKQWGKVSSDLAAIGGAFNDLADAVGEGNAGLKDTLQTLSNVTEVGSNAASSVASFYSGDIIGGVTKGIKAITGVFKIFNAGKESAKKAAIELAAKQDELYKGDLAYNQLLRERERTLTDISNLSLKELDTQKKLLGSQKSQAQAEYDKLLAKVQGSGQQVTGYRTEKYGGVFGIGKKTRTVAETAGIAGLDYAAIEKLFIQGKLDEATRAWFEELQKTKNELDAIGVSAEDVLAGINETATGTTADSIASAIVSGFKEGKRTAADFADDFKGLMEDSLLSVFKSNFLNAAIADFYKTFAAASADGLTEDEVATLKAAYSKIIEDSAKQLGDIEKITGKSVKKGASGAIVGEAVTEGTANMLLGITQGQYDVLKGTAAMTVNIYNVAIKQFNETVAIANSTLRTANNTDSLSAKLDAIIANTKPTPDSLTQTLRNGGIGGI